MAGPLRKATHTCETCGRVYPKPWRLQEHIASAHTGERSHTCDEPGCDKTFLRASHLKRHKMSHTGDKPFTCTFVDCELRFTTSTHLKRHLLLHERPRPYACTFDGCTEAFVKHSQLRQHETTHTGLRPYRCEHPGCDESFDFESKLRRHAFKHSDTKRYVCAEDECEGLGFRTWPELNTHMREVHRPDQYRCSFCDRSFRDRKGWRAHEETHNPERATIACTYEGCDEHFISQRNLQNHIERFHEGPKAELRQLRQLAAEDAAERERMRNLLSTDVIAALTGFVPPNEPDEPPAMNVFVEHLNQDDSSMQV